MAPQAGVDDERDGGFGHCEWTPGHPELSLIDRRGHVDLQLVVGLVDRRLEGQRQALAGGLQHTFHPKLVVGGIGHARRAKAHLGVVGGIEEVARPQMLVTLAVAGAKARGVDRQRHLPLPALIEL